MRSVRESEGQPHLPFDVPAEPAPASRRRSGADEPPAHRYRLRNDALASHGWPCGTELLVDPDRRPRRGQVALVAEGGRLKIGVFDLRLGRAVLRTDRREEWLGASARFVGVVTLAGAPLDGMPDPQGG